MSRPSSQFSLRRPTSRPLPLKTPRPKSTAFVPRKPDVTYYTDYNDATPPPRPKSTAFVTHKPDVTYYTDYNDAPPPRAHTSFQYHPEDEDPYPLYGDTGFAYEGGAPQHPGLTYTGGESQGVDEYPGGGTATAAQAWGVPGGKERAWEEIEEEVVGVPLPLKLVRKHGYGYRKPELHAVGPHWSQWPQQPKTDRPQYNVRLDLSPRVPNSAREPRLSQREPVLQYEAAMNMGDRNVIMHRGLSPRRQAPRVPGRSLTHYGSFGNREDPNPYIGGLDLHASPYNANRGYDQGITSYSSRDRQSRPMHRHMRTANKGEEYVHNHSNFYSTAPMVTGYFIIHPDWVSERLSLRRSQSLLSF